MKQDYKAALEKALQKAGEKGMTARELAVKLRVRRLEKEPLLLALQSLVKAKAVREKKGRYYSAAPKPAGVPAEVIKVTERFGFVRPEGEEEDVFIPGRALMGAMPGDRVEILRRRGRGTLQEGEVLRVTEEKDYRFSGVFSLRGEEGAVTPDNGARFPMPVERGKTMGAEDGDKVLARISRRGKRHGEHRVEVLSVFGSAMSAAACSEAILAAAGIEKAFAPEAAEQAEKVSRQGVPEGEIARRLDLRDETIFTIDGADSKDLDDAISLEKREDGWRLGVHIADVSWYVRENTPLDRAAFDRGTSVYYAASVVPMLPVELSNGVCSLNPGEDRLAFSALLSLDQKGALKDFKFCKSVIRSRVKGVYSEVNRILAGEADEPTLRKYAGLEEMIFRMKELADLLSARRFARGGLDLESTESKILIGPDGRAQEIFPRVSGIAEGMIEEFMLTANEAAARFGFGRKLPFLYRVHEDPPAEKLEQLAELLKALGLDASRIRPGVSSLDLCRVLESAKNTPYSQLVNQQLLRSMAKAKYEAVHKGHFGLVLDDYSHFTSPIRRYPDLAIHRIMSAALEGVSAEELEKKYHEFAGRAALHSSAREQRAMNAERDCEDCYKAEYMLRHVGEEFDGVVSSVAPHGVYVELPNTVEGMIRRELLPGAFEYDGRLEMKDALAGKAYRVGDAVRIQVVRADVSSGEVDFIIAGTRPPETAKAPEGRRKETPAKGKPASGVKTPHHKRRARKRK
ncbi:MAG: ribonuclease R [Oscillospiraceae bacterium]|nr:ribonuclease R [Oscillospiraceae bacterium]